MAAHRVPVVVVLGATGAGKSKLAIEIAKRFNGEIISADSMQIYKGLDIISNKVTEEEQRECPHHMISYLEPNCKNTTVFDFRDAAIPKIDGLLRRFKIPIIVGGTNYYIESLLWNFLLDSKSERQTDETCQTNGITNTKDKVGNPPAFDSRSSEARDPSPDSRQEVGQQHANSGTFPLERPSWVGGSDPLVELNSLSNDQLYSRLQDLDPEAAERHHPNNRRRILRALQVYLQTGSTMTSLLRQQHQGQEQVKSGSLRYPSPCILWVQCQRPVLKDRLDKRVDDMIQRGLLGELEAFSTKARELGYHGDGQEEEQEDADADGSGPNRSLQYPFGILQMIGFKEFHRFLELSQDQRQSEEGQAAFHNGVEDLKQATRRYARQQVRWIRNRFCSRPGPDVPPVYAVDSSDLSLWPQACQEAIEVVDAFCKGEKPMKEPEVTSRREEFQFSRNVCDVCGGRVFLHLHEWEGHVKSKKHRYNMKLARQRAQLASLMSAHERNLTQQEHTGDAPVDSDTSSNSNPDLSTRDVDTQ